MCTWWHVYILNKKNTRHVFFPPQRVACCLKGYPQPAPKCREWTCRSNRLRWRHPSWALPSHPEFYLGIISQALPLPGKTARNGKIHHAINGKTMGKSWDNGDLYGNIMKDPPCYENGKIHYFDWAMASIANFLCLPGRVSLFTLFVTMFLFSGKLGQGTSLSHLLKNSLGSSCPVPIVGNNVVSGQIIIIH